MVIFKRIIRWMVYGVLALLVLVVLLYGALQTPYVKSHIAQWIEQAASTPEQRIVLEGLSGHLPFTLQLDQLRLADAQGEWLTVQATGLVWSPLDLLYGTLSVETLSADRVVMTRLPEASEQETSSEPFQLPSFPTLNIGRIAVPYIELPAELVQSAEPLTLAVAITGDEARDNGIHARIETLSGKQTTLALDAILSTPLVIDGTFEEEAGGLVGTLTGLPASLPIRAEVAGRGSDAEAFTLSLQAMLADDTLLDMQAVRDHGQPVAVKAEGMIPETLAPELPYRDWTLSASVLPEDTQWELRHLDAVWGDMTARIDAIVLDMDEQHVTVSGMKANTPYGQVDGKAQYGIEDQAITADLTVAGVSLDALSEGAVQGTVRMNIMADGTLDRLPVTVSGEANNLANIPEPAGQWMGRQASLQTELVYQPRTLSIPRVTLRSGQMYATAKAQVPLIETSKAFPVEFTLRHEQYDTIKASANVTQLKNQYKLDALNVQTAGMMIEGYVWYLTESGLAEGDLALNISSITPLAGWLGLQNAAGSVTADLSIDHADGLQQLDVQAMAKDITVPDKGVAVENITVDANSQDVASLAQMQADIKVDDARMGGTYVREGTATLHSEKAASGQADFDIALKGTQQQDAFDVTAKGAVEQTEEGQCVMLDAVDGTFATLPFSLKERATLEMLRHGDVSLDMLHMTLAQGVVKASGAQRSGSALWDMTLADIPVHSLVKASMPRTMANMTVKATGDATSPMVRADYDVHVYSGVSGDDALRMEGSTLWDNTQSSPAIRTMVTLLADKEIGEVKMVVPASLSLQPVAFTLHDEAAMDGQATLNVPLAQLNGTLAPLGHRLGGVMKAVADIGGTVAKPDVQATLDWQNGAYDHLLYGVCLRTMDVQASYKDNQVTLTKLYAKGERKRGTLNGSGALDLGSGQIGIDIDMDKLALFCTGLAEGKIDGTLGVSGSMQDMLAKGELSLTPLAINLPSNGASSIPTVAHVYQHELDAKARQSGSAAIATDAVMRLDIAVHMPQEVFIRGRGLSAEFEGDMHVGGTVSEPEIDGVLRSRRGQIEVLGSTLTLDESTIRFLDRNPIKPYLNIQASSNAGGTEIQVALKGTVKKPKLTLSSDPALPNDEILALLLFGRAVQDITPFQAIQLARAASSLTGKGGGGSVLGSVRDALGVDTLNVGQDDDGNTTIGAGKYVTDRVFVGVEQGTTPDSRRIKTEIELTPDITAETSANSQGEPTVGVEWRYDY